jgi:hypothetical protein
MYNPGNQFPTFHKNYDDDIDSLCYAKTDQDLLNWMNNTDSLIKRLIMSPDPSKNDPQGLIDKLNRRLDTMKVHLRKRGCLAATPGPQKGIVKPIQHLRLSRGTQTPPLDSTAGVVRPMPVTEPRVMPKEQYANLVPQMEERILLRRPPPHQRDEEPEEKDTLLCEETLTQRIENEGKIFIK